MKYDWFNHRFSTTSLSWKGRYQTYCVSIILNKNQQWDLLDWNTFYDGIISTQRSRPIPKPSIIEIYAPTNEGSTEQNHKKIQPPNKILWTWRQIMIRYLQDIRGLMMGSAMKVDDYWSMFMHLTVYALVVHVSNTGIYNYT